MLRKLYYKIITKLLQKCYENITKILQSRNTKICQFLAEYPIGSSATCGKLRAASWIPKLQAGSCKLLINLNVAYCKLLTQAAIKNK